MMSTCPYCGAETRPGDNFCLSCGNRLVPANSSPQQQSQPPVSDATLPADESWGMPGQGTNSAPNAQAGSGSNWSDMTIANTSADQQTVRASDVAPTMQATIDKIDQPGKFILHSDSGEVLQEYPLEKFETSIGRAPNSDILLSKDKLTSRRHATVYYEHGQYLLRDERSANGTFVNGQQLEEMVPRPLQDGDHVGIGEHELIFRSFGSSGSADVEDLPTISVPFNGNNQEMTYRTRDDENKTGLPVDSDDFSTRSMDENAIVDEQVAVVEPQAVSSAPPPQEVVRPQPEPVAPPPPPPMPAVSAQSASAMPASSIEKDENVTFNRLTGTPLPSLPDITSLMAALSTLDGQVMALQEQLNSTQEAMRNHDTDIAQTTQQLRSGVRRVADRMNNTIADVARKREELAWTDLLQLMEEVQNNPRDIEYVVKLAQKARELNKVFQLHQNVLNTMAECNSLLRSLVGDDR